MNSHNPSPALPRYRQLADSLRQAIEQGSLSDNEPLPSERELAEQHDVSRDTVRKAVQFLEERGVVYSDHGRGTFVAPALVRRMSRFIDGFSQDTLQRGGTPGQRVLSVDLCPATMGIAHLLHIEPGQPLNRVRRVRMTDGLPVGLHDAYFPLPRGVRLDRAEVEQSQSLYKLLTTRVGFAPVEAIENLFAGAADAEEARLLEVDEASPLLVCERITLSDRREPIEYCLMKYVPSYRYSARISQSSGLV